MSLTTRSKFFITLALAFLFSVLFSMSLLRSSNAKATTLTNAARAVVSSPSANKRQTAAPSCPTCAPETQQTIYAPLFDVPEAASSEINLNCRSPHPMDVTPTFYTLEGVPIVGEVIHLQPAEIRFIETKSLIPAEQRQQRRWGGMSLSYTGRYMEAWAQLTLHGIGHGGSVNVIFSVLNDKRSNTQASVWWMPPDGTATLALGNSSAQSVTATLKFSGEDSQDVNIAPFATEIIQRRGNQRGGHAASKGVTDSVVINSNGDPGSLIATGFVGSANGKFTGSLRFYDTQRAVQPNLFATRIRMKNVTPHLLLRNTTAATVTAQPRFLSMAGESGHPVELPRVTLAPNEATEVELDPLMAAVANRSDLDEVSVQVLNSGAAGSLVGALYGTNQTTGTVYDVPLRDSGALRNSTGGYPIRLDGDYSTIISITNVSDKEGAFTSYINHENGRYILPVRHLGAGETAIFDVRKLRDEHAPDVNGHTLPASFTVGQFRWSIHGGDVRLLGRAQIVSLSEHVSSSYSCGIRCPSIFAGLSVIPGSIRLLVDEFTQVRAEETDGDPYGNYWTFEVSPNWSGDNNSIAAISYGSGSYQVAGIAPGETRIWASVPYERYEFDGQDCLDYGPAIGYGYSDVGVIEARANRGRIQAQGSNPPVQKSRAWSQDAVPTRLEGVAWLDEVWNSLTAREKSDRQRAYEDARRFIQNAPDGGYLAPISRTFQDPQRRDPRARIDIEVIAGSAFATFVIAE